MEVEVIDFIKVPKETAGSTELVNPAEPLTLADVKQYLRISSLNTSEDSFIESKLIPSARLLAEQHMDKDILAKNRLGYLPTITGSYVNLHFSPIARINQITAEGAVLSKGLDYRVEGRSHPKIYFLADAFRDIEINYDTKGLSDDELTAVTPGLLGIIAEKYRERDGKYMSGLKSNWRDWLAKYKNYGFYGIS